MFDPMPEEFIDSHCHLDFSEFNNDLEQVLENGRNAGIETLVIPAVARRNWKTIKQLCQKHSGLNPAYGLHPCFSEEHVIDDLKLLDKWLTANITIAVGECGLDFREKKSDKEFQRSIFQGQLELASKHQLPVIVHAVRGVTDVIDQLKQFPDVTGVLHSYSGSQEQAKQLLDLGYYFGFGGPVTWTNAKKVKSVVEYLPLNAILLESDAPDQPPQRYRGQRNEPAWVVEVAAEIAKIHNVSIKQVATSTSENAKKLFKLD